MNICMLYLVGTDLNQNIFKKNFEFKVLLFSIKRESGTQPTSKQQMAGQRPVQIGGKARQTSERGIKKIVS